MTRRDFIAASAASAAALALPAALRGAEAKPVLQQRGHYRDAAIPGLKELHRITQWLADQWAGGNSDILNTQFP